MFLPFGAFTDVSKNAQLAEIKKIDKQEELNLNERYMKLSQELADNLIQVLNAQSKISELSDPNEYKIKRDAVREFMNTKVGTDAHGNTKVFYLGGIKPDVFSSNKDNEALRAAAESHLAAAKSRINKNKEKIDSKPAADLTTVAADVIRYLKAKTLYHLEGTKTLDPAEARALKNKLSPLINTKKGGLSNEPAHSLNGKVPWKSLKDFEGIKEACEAHQAALKIPAKIPFVPPTAPQNHTNPPLSIQDMQELTIAANAEEILRDALQDAIIPSPSKNLKKRNSLAGEMPME